MRVGVCSHERGSAESSDIPEAPLVEMREIDHHPEPVAGAHQATPCFSQTRTRIRCAWKGKGHAVPKEAGTAPDRADRSQAGSIEHLQCLELRIYRLRPFKMQDCS